MKNSSVETHVANLLRVLVLVTHNHSRILILEAVVPAATPNITQLLPIKKPTLTSLLEVCLKYTVGEHGETRKNWCFPLYIYQA